MSRTRKTSRSPCRRVTVRRWRRLNRSHLRPLGGFEREPDYLTQMLASFRRAIRAYRRLAKLAPSRYDAAVVDREAQAREEQRRWMASWEPALEKAYGPPTPEEREAQHRADLLAGQPPPLHPRTQRAVDLEWANYEFWKAAGKLSWARYEEYQRRRPHDLPSLGKIAQMMEIAFDFGWIATGRDWRNPQPDTMPPPPIETDFEADLRRAYGPRDAGATLTHQMGNGLGVRAAGEVSDCTPGAPSSNSASSFPSSNPIPVPADAKPETQHSELEPHATLLDRGCVANQQPPPQATSIAHQRRDAWSTWARQLRRRST